MSNNTRERRKARGNDELEAERKNLCKRNRGDENEMVANVNKSLKSPKSKTRKVTKMMQKERVSQISEELSSENNNAQRSVDETPNKPIPGTSGKNSKSKGPKDSCFLGDDVTVMVDTTEFDSESDSEEGQSEKQRGVHETNEESKPSDYEDEGKRITGEISTTLNETTSTILENEIVFNFHRSNEFNQNGGNRFDFDFSDDQSTSMMDMVEQMVSNKLAEEKEKLKQEFTTL